MPSKKSKTKSKSSSRTIDLNKPHFCEWCHKAFAHESTLISHACEPRRRWNDRNTEMGTQALWAYNKFYQFTIPPDTTRPNHTWQEFSSSKHYTSFIKFSNWLLEQRAIESEKYVDWLLDNQIPFDRWSDAIAYQGFVKNLLNSETPEMGLSRSLKKITAWSEETGEPWQEFWLKVNANRAVSWVLDGSISPWMLYNCDSAVSFLERLTPEQLDMIQKVAPLRIWKLKIMKNRMQADAIKQTLAQAGM